MWLDILALLLLGIFAGAGAMRGALASGMGVLSLGVAYGAAIYAAPRFGAEAADAVGVPGWLGIPIAGTAAFLAAFLVMGLVSAILRRVERRRRIGSRSPRDHLLGGVFGALRGALVVLLLSYLALWVDALRTTGTLEALPELGSSAAAAVTESVVEAGVRAATPNAGSARRLMAHVAAHPGPALADLQAVMEDPAVADLRGDALFWTYVEHGNVDAALHRGSFVRLARDASLRRQLGDLGLIEEDAVEDPRRFRDAAAEGFREVGPRIRGLRQDPAVRELLEDPEVVAAIRSGDHLALMGHPGFRAVVARVMQESD